MKTTLMLGCSLVLLACSRTTHLPEDEAVATTTVTSAPTESDPQLIERIERAIASDRELSAAADDVEVDAFDGAVVLRGSVADSATKLAIVEVAEQSGHVVLDKIRLSRGGKVDPQRSDDTVAFKLQRAMVNHPAPAREMDRVTIDVVRGTVVLRGTTASAARRADVESLVRATPGVIAVRNELTVAP